MKNGRMPLALLNNLDMAITFCNIGSSKLEKPVHGKLRAEGPVRKHEEPSAPLFYLELPLTPFLSMVNSWEERPLRVVNPSGPEDGFFKQNPLRERGFAGRAVPCFGRYVRRHHEAGSELPPSPILYSRSRQYRQPYQPRGSSWGGREAILRGPSGKPARPCIYRPTDAAPGNGSTYFPYFLARALTRLATGKRHEQGTGKEENRSLVSGGRERSGGWSAHGECSMEQMRLFESADEVPKKTAKAKKAKSIPPSLAEVRAYCEERATMGRRPVDPERWYNHYESVGWKVGKAKMVNWQAAVRTWESNGYDTGAKSKDDSIPKEWLREEE